jgi:DNA-binding CsgD family transcriptional regulator
MPRARTTQPAEGFTSATTRTVVAMANQRNDGADPGVEPFTTLRAVMSGVATTADRQAHIHTALREAGLASPTFTPAVALLPDGTPVEVKVTRWQLPVLVAASEGLSNTEIAAHVMLNVETVKRHLGNLYRKFGVNSRVELVVQATRYGVIPQPVVDTPATPAVRPAHVPSAGDAPITPARTTRARRSRTVQA